MVPSIQNSLFVVKLIVEDLYVLEDHEGALLSAHKYLCMCILKFDDPYRPYLPVQARHALRRLRQHARRHSQGLSALLRRERHSKS